MTNTETIRTLVELESTIERGKITYIEVGTALGEIHDRRLYHEQGYTTFETYCRERWGFCRSTGYDYINAAKAAQQCVGIPYKDMSSALAAVAEQKTEAHLSDADEQEFALALDRAEMLGHPEAQPIQGIASRQTSKAAAARGIFVALQSDGTLQRCEIKPTTVNSGVAIAMGRLDVLLFGITHAQARAVREALMKTKESVRADAA